MPVRVGDQIEHYELLEPLGAGGQGSVWRARDLLPPYRNHALKLVPIRGVAEPGLERSRREGRLLAELDHPALVRCAGLFESFQNGLLVLVLDFVDGASLRSCLSDPRFDRPHRLAALRQLAEALAYLHARGMIHRDVKPDNVVVTHDFWRQPSAPGNVRLVDFGISAAIGNPSGLTDAGRFIGTLPYMAPETVDPSLWPAETATPALDVFAFGVLGWLLLQGTHPTGLPLGSTGAELARGYRAIDDGVASWSGTAPTDRWDEVLRLCISPTLAKRLIDGGAIVRALDGGTARLPVYGSGSPSTDDAPRGSTTRTVIPPVSSVLQPPPASSARSSGSDIRTSSPVLQTLANAPGPQPVVKRRSPVVRILATTLGSGLVLGAVVLVGESVGVLDFPRPPAPPTATTRTTTVPPTKARRNDGCKCEPRPCGPAWPDGRAPGACGDPIPQGTYHLRWSYLAVDPLGPEQGKPLFDVEPDSRVCFRVTGQPASSEVCVKKPSEQDKCAARDRLTVSLADVTGAGRGLDVSVVVDGGVVASGHVDPLVANVTQDTLCKGFVGGGRSWKTYGQWPNKVTAVGFFLDP